MPNYGWFIAGGATAITVAYIAIRLNRNTLRNRIAYNVTQRVMSAASNATGPLAGLATTLNPQVEALIATEVSYPVADGVLDGLGI